MALVTTATGDRYDRSCDGSIESIDSIDSIFLGHAGVKRNVRELEICVLSKFQLRTTLGDPENDEIPKRKISKFISSVCSVFRSVRSIVGPRFVVDRSGKGYSEYLVIFFGFQTCLIASRHLDPMFA